MLYAAIGLTIFYATLTALDKLEKEDELKKAEEEGYDVSFSR